MRAFNTSAASDKALLRVLRCANGQPRENDLNELVDSKDNPTHSSFKAAGVLALSDFHTWETMNLSYELVVYTRSRFNLIKGMPCGYPFGPVGIYDRIRHFQMPAYAA